MRGRPQLAASFIRHPRLWFLACSRDGPLDEEEQ